jgi:hypothetical protein
MVDAGTGKALFSFLGDEGGFMYFVDEFAKGSFVADCSFRGAYNVIAKGNEACYFGWGGGINVKNMEYI